MKIVVPLAGKDPRFEKLGIFKPLIIIGKKPLIYHVLASNGFPLEKIYFVILDEHEKKHSVTRQLKNYFGRSINVSIIGTLAEGAPNSILQIQDLINDDEDLLIDLGDIIRGNLSLANDIPLHREYAGLIPIDIHHTSSVWGYVTTQNKKVTELKEKNTTPIKGGATMGLYYFSSGREYVKYSQLMVLRGKRVSYTGMYYVGPVYNEYISDGKMIGTSLAKIKHVLGDPSQIDLFIRQSKI